jgi:hypothetical protein
MYVYIYIYIYICIYANLTVIPYQGDQMVLEMFKKLVWPPQSEAAPEGTDQDAGGKPAPSDVERYPQLEVEDKEELAEEVLATHDMSVSYMFYITDSYTKFIHNDMRVIFVCALNAHNVISPSLSLCRQRNCDTCSPHAGIPCCHHADS